MNTPKQDEQNRIEGNRWIYRIYLLKNLLISLAIVSLYPLAELLSSLSPDYDERLKYIPQPMISLSWVIGTIFIICIIVCKRIDYIRRHNNCLEIKSQSKTFHFNPINILSVDLVNKYGFVLTFAKGKQFFYGGPSKTVSEIVDWLNEEIQKRKDALRVGTRNLTDSPTQLIIKRDFIWYFVSLILLLLLSLSIVYITRLLSIHIVFKVGLYLCALFGILEILSWRSFRSIQLFEKGLIIHSKNGDHSYMMDEILMVRGHLKLGISIWTVNGLRTFWGIRPHYVREFVEYINSTERSWGIPRRKIKFFFSILLNLIPILAIMLFVYLCQVEYEKGEQLNESTTAKVLKIEIVNDSDPQKEQIQIVFVSKMGNRINTSVQSNELEDALDIGDPIKISYLLKDPQVVWLSNNLSSHTQSFLLANIILFLLLETFVFTAYLKWARKI